MSILKEQFANMNVTIIKVNIIKRSIAFSFSNRYEFPVSFSSKFSSFLRVTSFLWSGLSIQVKVVNDIFYCILLEETSSVTCWNSENSYSHTWRGNCFQHGLNFKFLQEKTVVWEKHCERIFLFRCCCWKENYAINDAK